MSDDAAEIFPCTYAPSIFPQGLKSKSSLFRDSLRFDDFG